MTELHLPRRYRLERKLWDEAAYALLFGRYNRRHYRSLGFSASNYQRKRARVERRPDYPRPTHEGA